MSHEREPQPEPAVRPGTGAIALAKAVEAMGAGLAWDPQPGSADETLPVGGAPVQLVLAPPALGRNLPRIARGVPPALLRRGGIAAARPRRRGQHRLEPDVLCLGSGT